MAAWWRVVRWVPEAPAGAPGHPTFVSVARPGAGRFDNPRHYTAGYVASTPEGAVGEVYADNVVWSPAMLRVDRPTGAVAALAGFDLSDRTLLDLDDPEILSHYGIRPSTVVRRKRDATRELALRIFLAGNLGGLQWWSYHRPEWTVAMVWQGHDADGASHSPFADDALTSIEPLSIQHPALVTAADVLRRPIRR